MNQFVAGEYRSLYYSFTIPLSDIPHIIIFIFIIIIIICTFTLLYSVFRHSCALIK